MKNPTRKCCKICGNIEKLNDFEDQIFCSKCIKDRARTFVNLEKGEFVNIEELEEEIEKVKRELDLAIEEGKEYSYIYQKSVEVDKSIAKYMNIMYKNKS